MLLRSTFFVFSLFVLVPFAAYADLATQTDWSGGDGVLGPVLDWGNEFYQSSNINWSDIPGSLLLSHIILEHTVDGAFDGVCKIYSEDINGDGDMDVLGAAYNADDITWWENVDGSGTSWTKRTVDGTSDGAVSVYAEDINDDGYMDVLGAINIDDDIIWWENDNGSGTSWTEHIVDGNFNAARCVYSEDIDGDGYMDILGAARLADDITWWENDNGSGTSWTEHNVDGDFDGAYSVYSADIDGDDDMDVLGAAHVADDITWWENVDGFGTSWAEHTVDGDFAGARSVYSEDIDGDNDMDVLGAANAGNDITWWENVNGLGTSWTEHTVDGNFVGARSVYSEDMDGDGDMDILGAANEADDITWWENVNGLGTSWIEHTVDENFDGARSIYSEDIDGDGNMDILGSAYLGNDITWWDIAASSPSGFLESSILDTQGDPDWDYLDWISQTPAGTTVSFQVRASDDHTAMGSWSTSLTSPCLLEGILNDGDRYVQYRNILSTSDPDSTPILNDVLITWYPLGIGDNPQVTEYLLFGAEPNPACGTVRICFAVPELSSVELSIFDLTGRLVIAPSQGEYSPGFHNVQLGDLSPGSYFCRMVSCEYAAIQRFVVIK